MIPIVKKECILSDVDVKTKDELLNLMVDKFNKEGYLTDREVFYQDILKREEVFPTFIGFETGIPHGKSKAAVSAGLCVCKLKNDIVWNEDGDLVKLVIMIAVKDEPGGNQHLAILAKLSRLLMHEDFREKIQTGTTDQIYDVLTEELAA